MLLTQITIAIILICITVVIHAVILDRVFKITDSISPIYFKECRHIWKIAILVTAVLGIFISLTIQIWLWASFYMAVDVLPDLEDAIYFSTSTYSTVGYGDLVLGKDWRLLSAIQSANGLLMFGWSTAFIFEVMAKLYKTTPYKKTKS